MSENITANGPESSGNSYAVPAPKRRVPKYLGIIATGVIGVAAGGFGATAVSGKAPTDPHPRFNCVLDGDAVVLSPGNSKEPDLYINPTLQPRSSAAYVEFVHLAKDVINQPVADPKPTIGVAFDQVSTYTGPGADTLRKTHPEFRRSGLYVRVPDEGPADYAFYEAPEEEQGGSDLCVAFHVDGQGKITDVSPGGHLPGVEVPEAVLSLYTSFGGLK